MLGLASRLLACSWRRTDRRRVIAEVERDAARAPSERAGADPHELTRGAQLVDPAHRVGADSPRKHLALPQLRGEREPLQRDQHLAQALEPGAGGGVTVDPLPRRQEHGERAALGRLDLTPQRRERRAAQPPQHLGVAPLPLAAARERMRHRPQLAAHQRACGLELGERARHVDAVARAALGCGERPVRAREASGDRAQRVGHIREEGRGSPDGGTMPSASR